MEKPVTKENLLQQADGLRDIARRSRRLVDNLTAESDRLRLQRHAHELEESASNLERQAVDAKTGVFTPLRIRDR
jgi:hypothetical protein